MDGCIFCKIVAGGQSNERVYQDDQVSAFWDVHPAAPTHLLIVPNRHIASVNELSPEDESLVGHMVLVARQLAYERGFAEDGYRLIVNTGPHGGQHIYHLHLHLLGGKRLHNPVE